MKVFLAILVAVTSGCASLSPQPSFDAVSQTIKLRSGNDIVWNTGTVLDKAVEERIARLLNGALSLEDAIQVSLLNNPNLQAEYEELGIAQSELVEAGLLDNLVLSVERRFRGRALEADVAASFLNLLSMPLRKRAAASEVEASINRVSHTVLKHIAEVKSAFYSLQAEQQNLEMRESVVKALGASYSAAEALREAGNIASLDLQNEATLLAQSKIEVQEAQVRVLEERERLNVLLGAWGGSLHWTVEKRLPNIPERELKLSDLESLIHSKRLDLLAAKKELRAIGTRVGLSRLEPFLNELEGTWHFEREPEGNSTRGPSLNLPIPLFNWGQAAKVKGEALFRQAFRRYDALAVEARSQVRVAYGRMRAARTKAQFLYNDFIPLQQKILEDTQRFYNGMFVGVFQLLQAKQAEIQAGQAYIEALKEYWLARTELEIALGGNFEGLETELETPVHRHRQESIKSSTHHHHS